MANILSDDRWPHRHKSISLQISSILLSLRSEDISFIQE